MIKKQISVNMEATLYRKLCYIAQEEGRQVSRHVVYLIRQNIRAFEAAHGEIPAAHE